MARLQTKGKCELCGGTFGKAAMTRHLSECLPEHPPKKAGKKPVRLFHIRVEGMGAPQYWLHVEAPETATFGGLDAFLRDIWLECCGHMSAFRLKGVGPYSSPFDTEFGDVPMGLRLGKLLKPDLELTHEYDFGSTTTLRLKVLGGRKGLADAKGPVRLLARNEPPPVPCGRCGQPATVIDVENAWERTGWLCDACARAAKVDEDMTLPVVNSPRTGVCGYTG